MPSQYFKTDAEASMPPTSSLQGTANSLYRDIGLLSLDCVKENNCISLKQYSHD